MSLATLHALLWNIPEHRAQLAHQGIGQFPWDFRYLAEFHAVTFFHDS